MKTLRMLVIASGLSFAALPLLWMVVTSLKTYEDTISRYPRVVPSVAQRTAETSDDDPHFTLSLDGYRKLGDANIGSQHSFYYFLGNSSIIALVSTLASVLLGAMCAYGFSRFRIGGAKDWLFFILSTRFMPPLAVVVPVRLMYIRLELTDSHLGLILLYTVFNLSLSVWLMKGFIDDIPKEYEEAALVDGHSWLSTFWRIVVPQAGAGMAVTAVFCLISAWNEFGFAVTLNTHGAVTVPVYFAGLQGNISGIPWPQVAAGALLFVAPIVVFTFLVRKHLLRGVTFGTIKQ